MRDPAVHARVCAEVRAWAESKGWTVIGIERSPITGPEGNVEFLLGAIRTPLAQNAVATHLAD